MVPRDLLGIEGVDHQRNDGDHPRVDRADEPRRPAALRAAGDDEVVDLERAGLGAGEEFLHAVHGLDGTFHHGQPHEPLFVLRDDVLHAAVGDEVVLFTGVLARVGKGEGLVGDEAEFGDDRVRAGGQGGRTGTWGRRAAGL